MSVVLILTPVIIGSWPAITGAVLAAAAAMGLAVQQTTKEEVENQVAAHVETENQVEVELKDSQDLKQNIATGQEIVLTKGTVVLKVRRDERGRCSVCATGKGHTDEQLRTLAEQFAEKMTQCFVYNRVMTELKAKGFQVVNEEMAQDDSVRIHVRRWEN
jgi:ABC-type transporter MlaC component